MMLNVSEKIGRTVTLMFDDMFKLFYADKSRTIICKMFHEDAELSLLEHTRRKPFIDLNLYKYMSDVWDLSYFGTARFTDSIPG